LAYVGETLTQLVCARLRQGLSLGKNQDVSLCHLPLNALANGGRACAMLRQGSLTRYWFFVRGFGGFLHMKLPLNYTTDCRM
jgi:hypothetical protein